MGLLCLLWFVTCKARVGTQLNLSLMWQFLASQVALLVKNLPTNAADIRDSGSMSRLGRSLGGGNGNPLQYSCLENLINRGLSMHASDGGLTILQG